MTELVRFLESTGFATVDVKQLVMLVIACFLLFLAIVKKFEPMLLLPIAFGMLLTNLPGANMYNEVLFAGGHVHWDLIGGAPVTEELIAELKAAGVMPADPVVQDLMAKGL